MSEEEAGLAEEASQVIDPLILYLGFVFSQVSKARPFDKLRAGSGAPKLVQLQAFRDLESRNDALIPAERHLLQLTDARTA